MINEIGRAGLNAILSRTLTIKGDPPSSTLTPEVSPSLTLESDRPEWKFLAGEQLFCAPFEADSLAEEFASAALFNPIGSNVIAIVERMHVLSETQPLCMIWGIDVNVPNATFNAQYTSLLNTVYPLDARYKPGGTMGHQGPLYVATVDDEIDPVAEFGHNDTVAARYSMEILSKDRPAILMPGSALRLRFNVVGQVGWTAAGEFEGRFRVLEPNEQRGS